MSKNKFEKAFCIELDIPVTPYFARELYFNEDSEYYGQKLNYICNESGCEAELYARCIYNSKRNKQVPNFAKKRNCEHDIDCDYHPDKYIANNKLPENNNVIGSKVSRFPSELLLGGFEKTIAGIPIVDDEIEVDRKVTKGRDYSSNTNGKKLSISRTSVLDNIVDCFEKGDPNLLKSEELTIGPKTKTYKSFFKNIKYYTDDTGLIYWGTVKKLKKYGKNYSITFNEYPWVDGRTYQVSIYIEDELIKSYRKNKNFREQLDGLEKSNVEIKCYFVGAYPEFEDVNLKNKSFKALKVNIANLDHISFTFDELEDEMDF